MCRKVFLPLQFCGSITRLSSVGFSFMRKACYITLPVPGRAQWTKSQSQLKAFASLTILANMLKRVLFKEKNYVPNRSLFAKLVSILSREISIFLVNCLIKQSPKFASISFWKYEDENGSVECSHKGNPFLKSFPCIYGSVSAGREKWPFNVLFFLKSRASVWPNLMR